MLIFNTTHTNLPHAAIIPHCLHSQCCVVGCSSVGTMGRDNAIFGSYCGCRGAYQPGFEYTKREACFPPDWAGSILDTIKFFSAVTIIVAAGILISLLGERQVPQTVPQSTSDRLHICQLVSPLLINTSMPLTIPLSRIRCKISN